MEMSINAVTPDQGPVGTTVEISGAGFGSLDTLLFGSQEVHFDVIDDNTLRAQVPDSSGQLQITLQWAGNMVSSKHFTIT
jgi:IPT/TIG domain